MRELVVSALALLLGAAAAMAQPADAVAATPSPATAAAVSTTPAGATASTPRVLSAASNDRDPERLGLGYVVSVAVEGLSEYLQASQTGCDTLTLFLADVPIQGLEPDSCDLDEGRIRYTLVRDEDSATAWRLLFTEPWEFTNVVSLTVGPNPRVSWPTDVRELELVILPRVAVYTYFATLVVMFLLIVQLARRTALLRVRGPGVAAGTLAPFSLARFQLGFWICLVLAAYVFIWMITGELDTITGSVLALLGIGSGTAVGAAIIDQGKTQASAAANRPASAPTTEPTAPPAAAAGVATQPQVKSATSQGFLRDVLSDEGGVSIHRFQLFVWTLVLGIIFASSVFNSLAMPQFSPTLLGLMGISSGTFLGLKVPEGPPAARG